MPVYKVQALDGTTRNIEASEGTTQEQILAFIDSKYPAKQEAVDTLTTEQGSAVGTGIAGVQAQQSDQPKILEEGEGSDFLRGFGTYGDQMGGIYGGAKVLAGKAFGSDDLIESGMESMQESEAAIGRRGIKETDSFTRAIKKGVGSLISEYVPFIAVKAWVCLAKH